MRVSKHGYRQTATGWEIDTTHDKLAYTWVPVSIIDDSLKRKLSVIAHLQPDYHTNRLITVDGIGQSYASLSHGNILRVYE